MNVIFECPVYCGRLKEWRVLNLNTATVYSGSHEDADDASNSIEHLQMRGGAKVMAVDVGLIRIALKHYLQLGDDGPPLILTSR